MLLRTKGESIVAVVIVIAQQKGGAGKTMLAANLAVAFAATHRTALLDTDPQRSLTRWHGLRPAVLVVNRAPTMPKLRAAALAEVQQAGHTVLPAILGNRNVFAQAFAQGLGVLEAAPRTIAAREMRALLDAVRRQYE
jgi:cellulose biosynthesis protein BcsQ